MLERLSVSVIGKTQPAVDRHISCPRPLYRIQQPHRVINMTFIKSIGKQCKSRFMHLTEAEAGMVCVGAALLNVLLIALWIWS